MVSELEKYMEQGRRVDVATTDDPRLGPLGKLPGKWVNVQSNGDKAFVGHGWNMIALPFPPATGGKPFRMLVNQYNEVLEFSETIGPVPNRGTEPVGGSTDQMVFALDYTQSIVQIAADDFPQTNPSIQGKIPSEIHHEPGFFLNIADHVTGDFRVARQGSIPHGNSVLAMGTVESFLGKPEIDRIDGLPDDGFADNAVAPTGYLAAYNAFSGANAFKGTVTAAGFPGFDVSDPAALLQSGIDHLDSTLGIDNGTKLTFDTSFSTGGIVSAPFATRQADPIDMSARFWIMELKAKGGDGKPMLALAYAQVVVLEFFPRFDAGPGPIRWPHVSINLMVKESVPKVLKTAIPASLDPPTTMTA